MGLYRASTKGFFIFSFSRHKSVVMSENSRVSVVQWRTMTLIIVSIYGESNYGSLPLVKPKPAIIRNFMHINLLYLPKTISDGWKFAKR